MIIHNDIIQGSEEWLALRLGKMTASHAQAIAAGGKGLDTLCRKLAGELFVGKPFPTKYKNDAMQRGNDLEPEAALVYSLSKGVEVETVGFVEYNEYVGCSPDRLVGSDGGLEIKCPDYGLHNDLILGVADFDSGYVWQCRMCTLILKREWWDLQSFHPAFKQKMLVGKLILPTAEYDDKLLKGFELGETLIKKYLEQLSDTPIKTETKIKTNSLL